MKQRLASRLQATIFVTLETASSKRSAVAHIILGADLVDVRTIKPAVPWISRMFPDWVMTTFMSRSAELSVCGTTGMSGFLLFKKGLGSSGACGCAGQRGCGRQKF